MTTRMAATSGASSKAATECSIRVRPVSGSNCFGSPEPNRWPEPPASTTATVRMRRTLPGQAGPGRAGSADVRREGTVRSGAGTESFGSADHRLGWRTTRRAGMTVVAAVGVLPRRMAGWAARRSLAPNALTGIGLACSLCAAAWFTSGTRLAAVTGGLALCAGYLARRIRAQLVAARNTGGVAQGDAAAAVAAPQMLAGPVLAGAVVAGPVLASPVLASPVLASPVLASWEGWLGGIGAALGELAVYAGLAVGTRASQRHGIWLLATDAAITLSIGRLARLCRPVRIRPAQNPPAQNQAAQNQAARISSARGQHARVAELPARSWLSLLAGRLIALSTGERTVVIAVTAPLWGARITFLALIVWGAVAAAWELAQGIWALGRSASGIAACRDDGPAARLVGRLVHGQLMPLPPALAGLSAIVLLAALGMGNLTGVLLLAPVAAMLLAAPGAGHPHDGRLDWLVPLMLLVGQYIFLVALGLSGGGPGPGVFGVISVG